MNDYFINLKKSNHTIELNYVSEPPHGDSYHKMRIDGVTLKGYVWGCMFLFPINQEYIVCSWMEKLYERKTIIINIENKSYHILNEYWYDFRIENGNLLLGNDKFKESKNVNINRIEKWISYS